MNSYTDKLKAKVIADILLHAGSLQEIAAKHNVPDATIRTWNSRLVKHSEVAQIETDETQVKQRIGDHLLTILNANLKAQLAQLETFANREWLEKQNAKDIGILHGILQDKAVMLIGAFGKE